MEEEEEGEEGREWFVSLFVSVLLVLKLWAWEDGARRGEWA